MNLPCKNFCGEAASILGFGLMRLPFNGPNHFYIDEPLALDMLWRAVDGGLNYLDTGYSYHGPRGVFEPGASEPFLGRALDSGLRGRVKVATKLPVWLTPKQADMDRLLNEQLKRLRSEHINFYLAHGLDAGGWENAQARGLPEFFHKARQDGRVGRLGFSFHDAYPVFEEIISAFDWDFVQIQYNYLDRNYQAGEKGLKLAASRGLPVVVMEPLRGGGLVRDLPPEALAVMSAARPDWSPADWALRWLWSRPEVTVVLSGMSEMVQLEDNLRIAADSRSDFGEKELAAIGQVEEIFRRRLKVGCTGCGYCRPCPHGVDIAANFLFYNQYHLLDSPVSRKQSRFYFAAQVPPGARAGNCLACGQCQERCPQQLPVSELMGQVEAWVETLEL